MNTPRLPPDVYEHIIDACNTTGQERSVLLWQGSRDDAQYTLFRDVKLLCEIHVDLLVRTLLEKPRLADLVIRLTFKAAYLIGRPPYVPFARLPLPRLLKNCVALDFQEIHWSYYPHRYADISLYQFQSLALSHLSMRMDRVNVRAILRFVWSLPLLQDLKLLYHGTPLRIPVITGVRGHRPCGKLLSLKLSDRCGTIHFPPLAFGENVSSLHLTVSHGISDEMLECVQSFRQLHTLSLWTALIVPSSLSPASSRLQTLIPVLRRVHAHAPLCTLEIYCTRLSGIKDFSYFTSREGFLDILSDEQLTGTLQRFAALEDLHFILDENDLSYGRTWWTAQLARRLPDPLHTVASVDVRLFAGAYGKQLWVTETEVAAAAQGSDDIQDAPGYAHALSNSQTGDPDPFPNGTDTHETIVATHLASIMRSLTELLTMLDLGAVKNEGDHIQLISMSRPIPESHIHHAFLP
ncbi:hypothetical protein C8Q76DRAFT_800327 [Earliella scabrosa]|nr:hypothetical protein C8Q76DRAFT_800327 [Earliella scabrosa]